MSPQKKEMHRVQLTVVGDKLTFDVSVSTPTSEVTTSKLCWKSVILTPGAKYLVVNFNNFYLDNPISKNDYYKI